MWERHADLGTDLLVGVLLVKIVVPFSYAPFSVSPPLPFIFV